MKKKNKKFYNFTEKEKRRDRNHGSWYTPHPWFVNQFNRQLRRDSKVAIKKVVEGSVDESYPMPTSGRNTAKWEWW